MADNKREIDRCWRNMTMDTGTLDEKGRGKVSGDMLGLLKTGQPGVQCEEREG